MSDLSQIVDQLIEKLPDEYHEDLKLYSNTLVSLNIENAKAIAALALRNKIDAAWKVFINALHADDLHALMVANNASLAEILKTDKDNREAHRATLMRIFSVGLYYIGTPV